MIKFLFGVFVGAVLGVIFSVEILEGLLWLMKLLHRGLLL